MWNGVYADSCFSFLVGFQGLIPLFRFPSLASCPFYIFRCKGFGFSLSNVLDEQTIFVQNQPPTVGQSAADCGKSATDFGQISDRLWENEPPTLGKSASDFGEKSTTDFGKFRHLLGKSVTDFVEIRHRFCGNLSPILGKSATDFGESVTDFGEIRHRL